MKRNVSDAKLREMVRGRITKGDAFRLKYAEYETRQAEVKTELASMTRQQIIEAYPYACYDVK